MVLIEHRAFYQFGFFVPHNISVTPEQVAGLMPDFFSLNMLPAIQSLPNIYLGLGESPANLQQLRFMTADKQLIVDFELNHRYLIQMTGLPGAKLPDYDFFSNRVKEIIEKLEKKVPIKAHRLSFVTTGIGKKMEKNQLDRINEKLFTLPEKFRSHKPIEWNSRQVCREDKTINGRTEILNIIMNISRIENVHHFEAKPTSFDGIEVNFDINTFQGNNEQRFSSDDVRPFLAEAGGIQRELESSLEKIISE